MIEIKGLKKAFDDNHVLIDINMHVGEGKIYGLVGSNGCGKTTIMKHIMSIYAPDAGKIMYQGQSIFGREYMSSIYYVQDDLFFPFNYTINDLFNYEKMFYPNASEAVFNKLKTYFKVDEQKKLRTLSKGQKRQAAFILAIASQTETLLLDEIVDGLDAVVRKKFWQVIMSEVMDRKLTLLISSHALTELDNICDQVGILHEGKIVKEESMEILKEETKRIQYAVKGDYTLPKSDAYEILQDKLIGKVHFVVLKGDADLFETDLYELNEVLLFEVLTMSLEEIFISELGGLGYGNEEYN
ncbi:MAG: ABC transporter ATP-binding protein [Clostridia bacterium]|nr:ABC transporter ATP-binding protein [Clostridia bacterium]